MQISRTQTVARLDNKQRKTVNERNLERIQSEHKRRKIRKARLEKQKQYNF